MLRYKFLFPLLLLIFAAVFSVGILTFLQTSRELEKVMLSGMKTSATLLKNFAETWIADRHLDVKAMSQNDVILKSIGEVSNASRKLASSRFDEIVDSSIFYDRFFLANDQGNILAASQFKEKERLPENYISLLKKAAEEIQAPGDVFEAEFRKNGKAKYLLIVRLFRKDMIFDAVQPTDSYIIADINVQELVKSLFDPIKFGETGRASLYDSSGLNLGSETADNILKMTERLSLLGIPDEHIEEITGHGVPKVLLFKNLQQLPWTIVVQIDRLEITEPAYQLAYHILMIGVCVIILSGILTLAFLHWILKPIHGLAETAHEITREKDYKLRATKFSDDELGVLVDSFNSMLTEIELYSENLKKAKEEADNANLMKGQFLATMSHEIRTPMNGIFGMTELLLTTKLTEKQKSYAQTVINSADSLLTILNDILDFSKIEAGKMELDYASFDLMTVVDDVADLMAIQAREKAMELIVRYVPGTPRYFIGDRGRIRQVISNLVNNALKFTDKGYVLINVEEDKEVHLMDGKRRVKISIQDTGIGIAEKDQKLVFDKFAQADSSTTRKYGGTGLGLAICKQLSVIMNGDLTLKSELGKGSTFCFSIPLKEDQDKQSEGDRSIDILKGVRTLVVDDMPVNCDLLNDVLHSLGMDCTICLDSEKAADIMRKAADAGEPFQIAIIDYLMPKINGEDLGHIIKNDEKIADTSLVMLTSASGVVGYSRRFHAAGYSSFLKKPIRLSELTDTLAHVWKRYYSGDRTSLIFHSVMDHVDKVKDYENMKFKDVKVLLAEDNRTNQSFGIEILQSANCQVKVAVNGLEALKLARKERFDMVFMDCEMPEMNGYDATRRLAEMMKESTIKTVPVVALTANVQKDDRDKCIEAGMVDYLSKPLRKADIIAMIEKWLPDKVDETSLGAERFDGYRVLLVEDNRTNRIMAEEILENMGFAVSLAENGQIATELIERMTVDLVLMDIHMPVMDGLEATRRIRDYIREGRIEEVPIVALTANAMKGDREKCFEAGMSDYLSKPIKKETLFSTLAKWLEPRKLDKDGYYIGIDPEAYPVLDEETFKAFRRDKKKDFIKETESFMYQTRLLINKIQDAWKDHDAKTVHESASALMSASGRIGAKQLSRLSESLAEDAKSYNNSSARELGHINRCVFDSLEKALKNVAPLLDEEIQFIRKKYVMQGYFSSEGAAS